MLKQGVQLPGKPENVREFLCKLKKVREFNKKRQVGEFCEKIIISQSEHRDFDLPFDLSWTHIKI